jgi:hypothetical protein
MADDTKTTLDGGEPSPKPKYELIRPKDGVYQTFTDFIHAFWTGSDFSLRFYKAIHPNADLEPNAPPVIEERAIVTMPWPQVKILRDLLILVVERREKVYGEIRTDYSEMI